MSRKMAGRINRGLYVGRFQPFHNGHLHAIEAILLEVNELIVGIAAVDRNFSQADPFTCSERVEMVWASLCPGVRQRCLLAPIPDRDNNSLWPAYVLSLLPRFEIAYTNNPLQTVLMKGAGIPTRPIPLVNRDEFQGHIIRSLLLAGDARWRDAVPPPVVAILDTIDATGRLRIINEGQEPTQHESSHWMS